MATPALDLGALGYEFDLTSDDNGNLTSNGAHIFAYDAENRLIRVTRRSDSVVLQEYAYDALGRRVRTVDLPEDEDEKVTTHVYAVGPACIAEYDSTTQEGDTEERWFAHGPSFPDPLVMVDLTAMGDQAAGEDEYLYYLKDLLGSVMALANSNGTVVERYVYDPYGGTTVLGPEGYAEAEYYHDADLDGDVDWEDDAHFQACYGSADARCVFVHDRNGNNVIDVEDSGFSGACFTTNGVAPGDECKRSLMGFFDVNGDGVVALFDFAGFQQCFGASDDLCLLLYDVDEDDDVDLADFAEFQASLGGPGAADGYTVLEGGSRHGNPFAWTGQRYDAAVGLHHFLYRSYSPDLGRWLQRDPLALRPRAKSGYQDGMSLYEYVRTSPTNRRDPSGLHDGGPSHWKRWPPQKPTVCVCEIHGHGYENAKGLGYYCDKGGQEHAITPSHIRSECAHLYANPMCAEVKVLLRYCWAGSDRKDLERFRNFMPKSPPTTVCGCRGKTYCVGHFCFWCSGGWECVP